ncbi:MAG: rod shape-determining protein MreC, partial [Desulfosarcinaceae bacterium]
LITVCVLFLALSSQQAQIAQGPGRLALPVVGPFQRMIIHSTHFCRDIWEHYFMLLSVARDNDRLREDLRKARALNDQGREVMLANRRLRDLLSLKEHLEQVTIAAQVIGKDPSPWFQTIIVDKGMADGVQKGLPVVNPEGIVGLVIEATGHYAKVRLITDPNSAVDALVQKNRARGIIKGGTSGYCVLNYVLRKHDVAVGDRIVSSGMDTVFPKGLPIGQVSDIIKYEAGIFQDVTVTPYVDFERLEEVLIIAPTQPVEPS